MDCDRLTALFRAVDEVDRVALARVAGQAEVPDKQPTCDHGEAGSGATNRLLKATRDRTLNQYTDSACALGQGRLVTQDLCCPSITGRNCSCVLSGSLSFHGSDLSPHAGRLICRAPGTCFPILRRRL